MHAWYLEPDSFRAIMRALHDVGETGFDVLRLYPSLPDTTEFWASPDD